MLVRFTYDGGHRFHLRKKFMFTNHKRKMTKVGQQNDGPEASGTT